MREVQVKCDDALLSLLSDRNIVTPAGVNRGAPGAPNRYRLLREGRDIAFAAFPGKVAGFPLKRGDIVVMESSGGGGWGDARDRPDDALESDCIDGFVTAEGRAAYRDRPVEIALLSDPEVTAPHHCRLASDVAQAIGASAGSLVEFQAAAGPAFASGSPESNSTLAGGTAVVAVSPAASRMIVRLIAAATPLTFDSAERKLS